MGTVQQSSIYFEVFVSQNWIGFVIREPRILVLDEWTNPRKGVSRCVGNPWNVLEGDVVLLDVCESAYQPRRKVWGGFPVSQGDVVRVGDDSRTVHIMSPLLQGGEQGEKFALAGWVVSLGRVELFGQAGNELHASVLVQLVQGRAKRNSLASRKIW